MSMPVSCRLQHRWHSFYCQYQIPCYIIVDLTKAFDTDSRERLWKIIAKFGCLSRFITIIRQYPDGPSLARWRSILVLAVSISLKQGRDLPPTPFSILFLLSWVMYFCLISHHRTNRIQETIWCQRHIRIPVGEHHVLYYVYCWIPMKSIWIPRNKWSPRSAKDGS